LPTMPLTPPQFKDVQQQVRDAIAAKHNSRAWRNSPDRDPDNIRWWFTKDTLVTKSVLVYNIDTDDYTKKTMPIEYMYTANDMKKEIERRLVRAETEDPRAHPDYVYDRFSIQELNDHVIPYLKKEQPSVHREKFSSKLVHHA